MRPRRFGRKFFGLASIGTSALVALLSAGRPALAQSDDKPAPAKDDKADGEKDEAFAKKVTEVEKGLNDFLLVDEDKKVHVRKEFAEGLPMPAPQLERMLQMLVKVGDDGKLRLRNPDQIRPFLP